MALQTLVEPREHVVQFYDHEHELILAVSQYLIDGWNAGEAMVVVTSGPHLLAFEAALVEAGIDLGLARSQARLITFDADEALRRFTVDEWPDADAFAAEFGDVLRNAAGAGRPIRVYGNMVALLWQAGHSSAAIELERLWSELGRQIPFALYCAYPSGAFGASSDESVRQICQCHSAVIGVVPSQAALDGAERSRSFPCQLVAVRAARTFVADTLASWDLSHVVDAASLVVSELATNAVIHARSEFVVTLSWEGTTLCISVHDSSALIPVLANPLASTISGRGLRIVAATATRWGTDPAGVGKLVWAELPT